jgi:hypothetical protein
VLFGIGFLAQLLHTLSQNMKIALFIAAIANISLLGGFQYSGGKFIISNIS